MRRSFPRLLVAGIATVTMAVAGLVAGGVLLPTGSIGGPQTASAEDGTCGEPIREYEDLIAIDPVAANRVMTDNHYNRFLGSFFGDNKLACGVFREAINIAAEHVVKIEVKRGTGVDWIWIKLVGQELNREYGQDKGQSQDKGRRMPRRVDGQ
jgi:hypothetical protein